MHANRRRNRPVRVLLVEDHELYARTIRMLLDSNERIEVVGRAPDGADGVRAALALRPDVVLMDIAMPVLDGIEATRRLRKRLRAVRIVMLTSSPDSSDVRKALAAGADAYLTKDDPLPQLEATILAGSQGGAGRHALGWSPVVAA
jgi:DNA-binding NarL/FixJ family response regulator